MSGIPDAIHVETGEVGMMKRVESKSPGMSLPGTIATLSNVFWSAASCCGLSTGLHIVDHGLPESLGERAEQMGIPRSQSDWGLIGYAAFGNVGRVAFAGCSLI